MNPAEFQANTPYASFGSLAIEAPVDARRTFLRKTYTHLTAAIYGLVMLEFLYFKALPVGEWTESLFNAKFGWFALFGGYMVISYIADRWARTSTSIGMQYAGLFTYVFAFSVILCPILYIATGFTTDVGGYQMSPIVVAAIATLVVFTLLTAFVFLTKTDFSFLGPILGIAGLLALGAIGLNMFGWLNLGTGFMMLMVLFAAGAILYDTSNILHHYRTEQYVAASLALFASVGILFWYILQIVISLSGRD